MSKKLKILIADDIQETRRNTRLMVAALDNMEVVAIAANGKQAVEMSKEHHPDIALLDINMPEMDGLSAAAELFKMFPHMGCIILSAERDPATFRKAMAVGIREYLIKPFTVEELEAAIKQVSARVEESRNKILHTDELKQKNESYLRQLAEEYTKSKRTDDQAIEVFEALAEFPKIELHFMQNLAMIYIVRHKWAKLKTLAEKLEKKE
jgi:YesN/AraC family two-component response regulator